MAMGQIHRIMPNVMSEKSMRKPSGTDWERLRTMQDEDIEFDDDSPRTQPKDWEGAKITLHNRVLGRINIKETETPPEDSSSLLRLSADVLAYFKSTGPNWQTRVEDALKEWIKAHPLA